MQKGWPTGIDEDPEARLMLARYTNGPQSHQATFGLVSIAHAMSRCNCWE